MIIEIVNKKKPEVEKEEVEIKAEDKKIEEIIKEVEAGENSVELAEVTEEVKDPIDDNNVIVRYKPYEPDAKAMPDGDRWVVKCDGKWYLFKRQKDAVKFARLVAADRGVDVAVHAAKTDD